MLSQVQKFFLTPVSYNRKIHLKALLLLSVHIRDICEYLTDSCQPQPVKAKEIPLVPCTSKPGFVCLSPEHTHTALQRAAQVTACNIELILQQVSVILTTRAQEHVTNKTSTSEQQTRIRQHHSRRKARTRQERKTRTPPAHRTRHRFPRGSARARESHGEAPRARSELWGPLRALPRAPPAPPAPRAAGAAPLPLTVFLAATMLLPHAVPGTQGMEGSGQNPAAAPAAAPAPPARPRSHRRRAAKMAGPPERSEPRRAPRENPRQLSRERRAHSPRPAPPHAARAPEPRPREGRGLRGGAGFVWAGPGWAGLRGGQGWAQGAGGAQG